MTELGFLRQLCRWTQCVFLPKGPFDPLDMNFLKFFLL